MRVEHSTHTAEDIFFIFFILCQLHGGSIWDSYNIKIVWLKKVFSLNNQTVTVFGISRSHTNEWAISYNTDNDDNGYNGYECFVIIAAYYDYFSSCIRNIYKVYKTVNSYIRLYNI